MKGRAALAQFAQMMSEAPDGAALGYGLVFAEGNGWRVGMSLTKSQPGKLGLLTLSPGEARKIADAFERLGRKAATAEEMEFGENTASDLRALAKQAHYQNNHGITPWNMPEGHA